jgi:hypothetical protein
LPKYRRDPEVEAPIDGAPGHDKVNNKDPEFEYLWATKDELGRKLSAQSMEVGSGHLKKRVFVQPWIKCKQGEETSEEFAGFGSISGGEGSSTNIENGEMILLKRPAVEGKKLRAALEDTNKAYDKRIYGDVEAMRAQGVPVTADVSDQVIRSE